MSEGSHDDIDAAAAALARARAKAAEAGLRPGSAPQRRRRVGSGTEPRGRRDGRDFALIGDQIDAMVTDRGWDVDVAAGAVMSRWPAIVGANVAEHCTPVTFEDALLTIRCDSTAWATNLRMMSSQILERITAEVGPGVVADLRIVGPAAPSWSRGPRRVSDGRGPRDTYG
ncbi:MAG: DciA family protein [Actinomycetia bacterium]|nr:DciA family protein [Actinomycetes bacterium]